MSIQAVAWVLDHSESRGLARLVLISLANHANRETGECWPSMRTIAAEAGVSLGVIPSKVNELVKLGELEVTDPGTRRTSARYRLPHPSVQETNTERSGDELTVQPRGEQNRKEPKTSPNGDGVFEAFFGFWTGKPYEPGEQIPKSMRGRLNAAVKEAGLAGITASEVVARGQRYVETWREMERTPQALLANWSRFAPEIPVEDCGECGNRGVLWFNLAGEKVDWDAVDADSAMLCEGCRTGAE